MKIKLKETPEQMELIRAIGSRDKLVAAEASEALAAFLGPVIQKVLQQAGSASLFYADSVFDEDDNPSYPLDLYYDEAEGYITVTSQSIAGGMPTNQVEGVAEMKISTYRLDSAVSFLKKYARKSRLDIVSKALNRLSQEVLIKQERNAWSVVLKALANASTNSLQHVIRSQTAGVFEVGDLSKLMTRIRRINSSWASGTPADFDSRGLTDLFVSPEIKEQIRGFAFNPMNTKGSQSTGPVALDDQTRRDIFKAAGASEIYGVSLMDLLELGQNQKYNTLFDTLAGSTTYTKLDGTGSATFTGSSTELLVGIDMGREAFIRPVARQADSGGTFSVLPDDQWATRAEKTGWYGFLEEGRVCIDSRPVVGMIV
jgi:hypothetical protein